MHTQIVNRENLDLYGESYTKHLYDVALTFLPMCNRRSKSWKAQPDLIIEAVVVVSGQMDARKSQNYVMYEQSRSWNSTDMYIIFGNINRKEESVHKSP